MSRLIFLNRFFFPDHSATSQILTDLAFHVAKAGHSVHVVTSQQIYDDRTVRLPSAEIIRGVHVHRVAATRFGRFNLIGRSFDYLSFYLSMWRCVASFAQPGDILIAKTDPPMLSVLAATLVKRRTLHLVNWLQDLYPEIAMELGFHPLNGPVGNVLVSLRNRSLDAADANVVLGKSMAERVRACGVRESKIHTIPNWVNDEEIVPVSPVENPLRRKWGLMGKFVVGYSGNLGRAHEYGTLLAAAESLRDDSRIAFVLIGGGKQFDELAEKIRERKLETAFRFFPYQDQTELRYSLSVPDVHWLSLRSQLEGLIFPSKLYGIAAAGRPIIAITNPNGEVAELVHQYGCGFAVGPGDPTSLTRTISFLANNSETCKQMGIRARAMLCENFNRRQALTRWLQLIEKIQGIEEP